MHKQSPMQSELLLTSHFYSKKYDYVEQSMTHGPFGQLRVFVNKILLQHSPTLSFVTCFGYNDIK